MSYDEALATDRDVVRMYLGDTSDDAATELMTDAHIDAVLTFGGSVARAVVILARELLARFANKPASVTIPTASGALSVSYARKGWEMLITSGIDGTLGGSGAAFSTTPRRNDGYAALEATE